MKTKYFITNQIGRLIVLRKFNGNKSHYFTNKNKQWFSSNASLFEIEMYEDWHPISRDAARKKYPKAF